MTTSRPSPPSPTSPKAQTAQTAQTARTAQTAQTAQTARTAPTTVLREMRWWDIEPVLELERALFPEDAWSAGMFWSELADSRHAKATRWYTVAEDVDGRIVGYAGLMAIAGEGDVQTIAVAENQWGTGLGTRLLQRLIDQAQAARCTELLLEVRVDNDRAQRLYTRFGFEPVGFRRNYYQPSGVDALVMRRPMAEETHEGNREDDGR